MDEVRAEIERDYVVERTGWAAERIARVSERLQRGGEPLDVLVVWLAEHTAFTTFGRTIYISRRLLERLPDDDAAAFVVAHELAHHRLGHVPGHTWALPAQVVVALLSRWVCSARHETHADLLAIEMCVAAGYDPERCLAALEILALVALDYGDVDGVLGSSERRSHPALADRIAAIRAHVAGRVDVRRVLAEQRQRRRKRLFALGGAAAAALAFVAARRR